MAMRKSSSRTTRKPGSEVSAISARHSRVKSSTIARIRKRRPSDNASEAKSRLQRWLGPLRNGYWRPPSHGTFATTTPAHLKAFLAIKPAQLLVIHGQPLADQEDVKRSIAKPTANGRELAQAGPYRRIVRPAAAIAHRRSIRSHCRTRPPFGDIKRDPKLSDGLSSGGGRHHFFAAISLSIALSSIASAKSFLTLVFSSSSGL